MVHAGDIFGRYKVLAHHHGPLWLCACDCGATKLVHASGLQSGAATQCRKCADKSRALTKTIVAVGDTYGQWVVVAKASERPTLWLCRCSCGKEKVMSASPLRSGMSTRCRACGDKHAGSLQRGTHHWNYRHDLTEEYRKQGRLKRALSDPLWVKVSAEARRRADYTCAGCGSRGGALNAHHVYPWKTYPELRYDINNCVVLCEACHKDMHHTYGLVEMDPEDTIAWLTP
jgi:5-methylcytosine-specific restriction endonuclease McrA